MLTDRGPAPRAGQVTLTRMPALDVLGIATVMLALVYVFCRV